MDVILEKMEKRRSNLYLCLGFIIIVVLFIIKESKDNEPKVDENNFIILGVITSIVCIATYLANKKIEKRFLEDYNNLSLKDKEIIEKGIREPEVDLKKIIMTEIALLSINRSNCVLIFYRDITKVVSERIDRIARDSVEIFAGDKRCSLSLKYSEGASKVVSTILKHNHRVIVTNSKL
jgi:hypothetical protein